MSAAVADAVDRGSLEREIDFVCRLMGTHAGAIELIDVSDEGAVTVRFVGMCQGCALRPVTLYGSIIPALSRVAGVTEVRAEGVRVSAEAAARASAALASTGTSLRDIADPEM